MRRRWHLASVTKRYTEPTSTFKGFTPAFVRILELFKFIRSYVRGVFDFHSLKGQLPAQTPLAKSGKFMERLLKRECSIETAGVIIFKLAF